MLTRVLLSVAAFASLASAQNSASSSSTGAPQSSSSVAFNVSSSTGIIANMSSSTGTIANMSSSTGIIANMSSSTGIIANMSSSTGIRSSSSSSSAFVNISSSSTGPIANMSSSTGIRSSSSSSSAFVNVSSSSSSSVFPPVSSSTGIAPVKNCGGAGYDLSSIANMDITLAAGEYTWGIRPCGTVSPNLDLCDGQMCQDDRVISRYEPSLVNWVAIPGGVKLEVQNGDRTGCAGPRESDIHFICNATASTPRFVSVNEDSQCHYRAVVHTAAACNRNSSYQPGVGDAFTSTVCGGGAYDLGRLNNADITGTIGLYNFSIRVCGLITNPACAAAQPVSICQQQGSTVYKLADYTRDLPLYELNSNGMNMSLESGTPCGGLGNRTTMVQFECDAMALTPVIIEASEYYTCEYWFRVRTNAVCGAPFQVQSSSSSSSSSTGIRSSSSSSSTGMPQSSSSSSSSSVTIPPPVASSSSSSTFFPVDSSSSGDFNLISSTGEEQIDNPELNGASAVSISGLAIMASLMAAAMAL